ncbi:MAG: hydrolase [Halorientalis sp.]
MLDEWTAAAVEPGEGEPDPEGWAPVEVPGRPSQFAGADAVAYRATFEDPREDLSERALLVLRGLYAHARVWLNGDLLGSHDAYVRPFRHVFEPAAHNELVVECRRPEDRFGGIHDTDEVPAEAAVPGIWWGATVETHPATFVSDLQVRPRVEDGDGAIDVRATVAAAQDLEDRITLSLRPEGNVQGRGMMDRAGVEAAAGETVTVEHTIDVPDPALWWPRDLGPQNRYAVRAKLDGATRSVTTGLCSVTWADGDLRVNGERVPVRGVNLLSATPSDVDRAVETNATLVRLHAHAAPEAVYEACDEAGLLVWQDLPLTGPGDFDVERGRAVGRDVLRTAGGHPSLAALAVHDDPVEPFADGLGSGALARLRLRWRAWRASYDDGAAERVAEDLPTDRPVFPVVGPPGVAPDALALYPGWDYGSAADVDWLVDRYDPGVVAEFGAGALGGVDPGDIPGFDRAKHDAHVEGGTEASQRYQARVCKRVAETLRRRERAPVAFALRDIAGGGMGVLEADGTEKAGHAALRSAYEPVQATLTAPEAGATGEIVVLNDTPDPVEGEVAWEAGETTGSADVAAEPGDRATAGTVALPDSAERATLTLSLADRTVENAYYL